VLTPIDFVEEQDAKSNDDIVAKTASLTEKILFIFSSPKLNL
jgi:hypothetical protein